MGRVNNPARNANRLSVEQLQQASQLARPQRASENTQAQENLTSRDQKRQKQPGRSNACQAVYTEHSNHEHILDEEEFDVYNPEYSEEAHVWVERFTAVCGRSQTQGVCFRLPLPPPDVDTTLYESPKLLELIKNVKYYGQVISLLNIGACVKPNPEKAGNGAKPIPKARFLSGFTVLPIHLAILNRTRNTPVEFIEKMLLAPRWCQNTDKKVIR
jgi:hypothetical protein